MPKRAVEKQLEFPLMSIVYDPLAVNMVLIELQQDWGLTGEIYTKYQDLQSLKDAKRLLEFVINDIADTILIVEKLKRQKGIKKSAPPT